MKKLSEFDREQNKKYSKFLTKHQFKLKNKSLTYAESVFAEKLKKARLKYYTQYKYSKCGIGGVTDFYLPNLKIAIEIDGGYHKEEEKAIKDIEQGFVLTKVMKRGLIRLTNKQALEISIKEIYLLVRKAKKNINKKKQKEIIFYNNILNIDKNSLIPR